MVESISGMYMCAQSCPTLCDPIDCSPQVPLSMGFSKQEYWSRLPFPTPGDLPDSESNSHLLHWRVDFLPLVPPGKPILADEAKLCSVGCAMCSWGLLGENWVLSVDQCQLQALQFSVHLIHLLSILLKYNGFAGIQEAVVDQTVSKPLNSNKLFLVQVWLWEVLWSYFLVQPY